jgi:hypothetical protein
MMQNIDEAVGAGANPRESENLLYLAQYGSVNGTWYLIRIQEFFLTNC